MWIWLFTYLMPGAFIRSDRKLLSDIYMWFAARSSEQEERRSGRM